MHRIGIAHEVHRITLRQAVTALGITHQLLKSVEELAELQKELAIHANGIDNKEKIADELADVEIMLEQIRIIFTSQDTNFPHLVGEIKSAKLHRLKRLIFEHSAMIFEDKALDERSEYAEETYKAKRKIHDER